MAILFQWLWVTEEITSQNLDLGQDTCSERTQQNFAVDNCAWSAMGSCAGELWWVFLINSAQSDVNRFQVLRWLNDLIFHFKACSAQETRLTLLGFLDFRCASSSQVGFRPWGSIVEIFPMNINKQPTSFSRKAESVFLMTWKGFEMRRMWTFSALLRHKFNLSRVSHPNRQLSFARPQGSFNSLTL